MLYNTEMVAATHSAHDVNNYSGCSGNEICIFTPCDCMLRIKPVKVFCCSPPIVCNFIYDPVCNYDKMQCFRCGSRYPIQWLLCQQPKLFMIILSISLRGKYPTEVLSKDKLRMGAKSSFSVSLPSLSRFGATMIVSE